MPQFCTTPNTTLFYVDQNNRVWNLTEQTYQNIELDMDVRFRLHGNPLEDFHQIGKYEEEDFAAIQPIRDVRKFSPGDFTQLVNSFSKRTNLSIHSTRNGSTLVWNKKDKEFLIRLYNHKGFSQMGACQRDAFELHFSNQNKLPKE